MQAEQSFVRPAGSGEQVRFWSALGTRRVLPGGATGGAFAIVEHDLPPRQLGAPVHTHAGEDEYSYVLSGRLTAQIGEEILEAGPGDVVLKPRGIAHAFWNAGDEPVRFLEVISPAPFEEYFFEAAGPLNAGDLAAVGAVAARHRLDLDLEGIPGLIERHSLLPPF
jgi:quercetin dioxygenase-like cupin family protein